MPSSCSNIRAGALPRARRGGFLLFLLIWRGHGTTDFTGETVNNEQRTTSNEQRVPAGRRTTSNGKFVLWVRRVNAMPSWIGAWIWLMVPVTAELESQGPGLWGPFRIRHRPMRCEWAIAHLAEFRILCTLTALYLL